MNDGPAAAFSAFLTAPMRFSVLRIPSLIWPTVRLAKAGPICIHAAMQTPTSKPEWSHAMPAFDPSRLLQSRLAAAAGNSVGPVRLGRRVPPQFGRRGFLKLAGLAAAGAALPLVPRAGAASAQVLHLSDKSVSGLFSSVDPTGCLYADVVINSSLKGYRDGGSTAPSALTEVTISITDVCIGNTALYAVGISNADGVLQFEKDMRIARVKIELSVVDSVFGGAFVASVDVIFTATGPTEKFNDVTITKTTPGIKLVERFSGSVRPAAASGTLFGAGTVVWPLSGNQIPLPSIQGTLQTLKWGTVTISH